MYDQNFLFIYNIPNTFHHCLQALQWSDIWYQYAFYFGEKHGSLTKDNVEILSQYTRVGPSCSCLISSNTICNKTAWEDVVVLTTYSSSAEENFTMGYFLNSHEITPTPKWKT